MPAFLVRHHLLFEWERRDESHDCIRNRHNGFHRAIIATQLIVHHAFDLFMERQDEVHRGTPPGINVLRIISHNRHGGPWMIKAGEQFPLNVVDVLEFVHDDGAKTAGPCLP